MNNKITIDLDEIRNAPNFSISDIETIRQISLHACTGEKFFNKVNPMYAFCGLYPEIMSSFDNTSKKN